MGGGNRVKMTDEYNRPYSNSNPLPVRTAVVGTSGAKDTDYKITIPANVATQVPASANVPNYDYVLVLGNRSDTNMVWGNSTGIIDGGSIDKGTPIVKTSGAANIKLNANKYIYVACSGARQLNYTIFQIIN